MKAVLWLILAPILLIVVGVIGTELNKAYWDSRVREMCAEDGGVQVIEKIAITPEQVDELGQVGGHMTMAFRSARPNAPAYKEGFEEIIKESNPRVLRREEKVFRMTDEVQTGSLISYIRIGGDFPTGIASDSSYKCPPNPDYYAIQEQFFQIQGDE